MNLEDLMTGGPTTASSLNSGFGRAGADVTSVTLVTQAGEKIPAKVQHGIWTALWPIKSQNDTTHMTLTWTISNGTTYTVPWEKSPTTTG